jgi:hypothetical protein
MDRADLHALVESLPEAAFENANRILQHLQAWPPLPPPEMERMRWPKGPGGVGGGFGGGGRLNRTAEYGHPKDARWEDAAMVQEFPSAGYGHCGNTRWEDSTVVQESCHFYKGHEIVVTERLQFADEGKAIQYTHEAKGPKGDPILNEMKFVLE